MTEHQQIVGPKDFVDQTGLTRQTFYNCLKKMKSLGMIPETQKKLDLSCQYMQNYLAESGTGQKKHRPPDSIDTKSETQTHAASGNDLYDDMPDMAKLQQIDLFEKVKKTQIDNAVKAKKVVSTVFVQKLIDCIDEVLNNIIVDGQASLLPKIVSKARAGETDEKIAKFWHDEVHKIVSPVKPRLKRAMRKEMDE